MATAAVRRTFALKFKTGGSAKARRGARGVSKSLRDAAASADQASGAFGGLTAQTSQMGKSMEEALDPIDGSLKGFDRLNGILGQVTNATRLLSGVAFIELGKALVDVGKKAVRFVTDADRVEKALKDQATAAKQAEAAYKGLSSEFGDDLLDIDIVQLGQIKRLDEGIKTLRKTHQDALADAVEASVNIESLGERAEALVERVQRDAEIERGIFEQTARTRAFIAADESSNLRDMRRELTGILTVMANADALAKRARSAAMALRLAAGEREDRVRIATNADEEEEKERLARARRRRRPAPKAAQVDVDTVAIDEEVQVMELRLAALDAEAQAIIDKFAATPAGPAFGGALRAGAESVFDRFAAGMDLMNTGLTEAQREADATRAALGRVVTAAQASGAAFSTASAGLDGYVGALSLIGESGDVAMRASALLQAGMMAAKSAEMWATSAGTAAGSLFGFGANPALAAAQAFSATAFAGAAGIYAAVAAGIVSPAGASGGGGGGAPPSAQASPQRQDFGRDPGAAGGGDLTIVVNSGGQMLSTAKEIDNAISDALVRSLRTRGSSLGRRLRTFGL